MIEKAFNLSLMGQGVSVGSAIPAIGRPRKKKGHKSVPCPQCTALGGRAPVAPPVPFIPGKRRLQGKCC